MNVLLLNASPHPAGIVSQALDAAASTARQAGAETVKAELYRAPIAPCTGCMRCRATGVCPLPHDAAHELGEAIRRADLLVVGTPTYWGGMAARLKLLFERLVPVFMGESPRGIPQPRLKGRQAVVIAACTTPWPFNLLFRQSRGAVRSVREVLSTGGMRIRSVEIAGTKALDGHLPEGDAVGAASHALSRGGSVEEVAFGVFVSQHHVGHAALAVGHLHRDNRRAVVRKLHFGSRVVAQRVANDCLALRGHAPDVLFDLYHSLI